jgi:hypothetical protein
MGRLCATLARGWSLAALPAASPDDETRLLIFAVSRAGSPPLVVKDDVEKGAVHVQRAVVFDKAEFPELVHKEAHTGTRRTDHLGKGFLADVRNTGLRFPLFSKPREQQKGTSQSFLARIEKLIY